MMRNAAFTHRQESSQKIFRAKKIIKKKIAEKKSKTEKSMLKYSRFGIQLYIKLLFGAPRDFKTKKK